MTTRPANIRIVPADVFLSLSDEAAYRRVELKCEGFPLMTREEARRVCSADSELASVTVQRVVTNWELG